ncbi:nickel-dependent lactate racemase [Fontisphaera persica]|uniref:nickel-dependent lactate racemase n=1 Tax=Fontisphaera persica TaxID=2974023 RepID=UPI0024BF7676|nr:nickel-dependent lactate racemase [Fontisphaera persica]WCJ59122.1 nickel-dependent lactate racemase [Fontisphaera persica]
MQVKLAYGRQGLTAEFPDDATTVIEPREAPGLPDERQALLDALEHPISARPLREWLRPGARVCITFTDLTRATPNERLIPWLLEYLTQWVPPERITLLNSLGTHRPNTPAELQQMLGPEIVRRYRVEHNDPENEAAHVPVGALADGTPVLLSRHLMEAEVRIVTGFIEPHFFAGFSGGPKGLVPGIAHQRTVFSNHGPRNLSHAHATFGITRGNPLWEELLRAARLAEPVFLCNVTLNTRRQITGVFAGDLELAHHAGTEFVRRESMCPVEKPFEVVVTTNSGYPLDLNLYQGVKGMAAAARTVRPGGCIILACECSDGVPAGSAYERWLRGARSPAELLAQLATNPTVQPDQWQVQIQAQIQQRAEVLLHSSLPPDTVRACLLTPCEDIAAAVRERLRAAGPGARVAVLPHGPLTIPYLTGPGPAV